MDSNLNPEHESMDGGNLTLHPLVTSSECSRPKLAESQEIFKQVNGENEWTNQPNQKSFVNLIIPHFNQSVNSCPKMPKCL